MRVAELAGSLAVSEATVRRDLRALAAERQLVLVYGGAALPRNADFSFHTKSMRNVEGKQVIGCLAAEMVADGDRIFLDSGTTCFAMAAHLKSRHGLSIIVNSARLALEFETPHTGVIMLGGQYRPDRMDTVGPLATTSLDQLRGYTAFIGADGLSMDFGLTAGDIESAHLYRLVCRGARDAVLVADHGKFSNPSLYKIVEFDAIRRLVTDKPPSREWADFLAEHNVEVICPPPEDVET